MAQKYFIKPGDRFNFLTAVCQISGSLWEWRCDCGGSVKDKADRVCCTPPHRSSCGCRAWQTKHGRTRTKEYQAWKGAKYRCTNPNHRQYPDYGGRGITMCQEWRDSFEAFLRDMGEAPEGTSLERIDNDKGYYPKNCMWTSPKEQANNRRDCHDLEYNGKKQTLTQWAEEYKIPRPTLDERIRHGWKLEQALTVPVGQTRQAYQTLRNDQLIRDLIACGRINSDIDGNIYSGATGKGSNGPNYRYTLKKNPDGRLIATVSLDGVTHSFRCHRIVAIQHVPNDSPQEKNQVDHINGDPSDNRACNLRWVSNKQNQQYYQDRKKNAQ